jgi:hypothetical protein
MSKVRLGLRHFDARLIFPFAFFQDNVIFRGH